MPRKSKRLLPRLRSVRRGARWMRKRFARAPRMVRIAGSVAILLAVAALLNIVYHVIRKPTELFVLVGNALDKEPAETWRQYGAAVPQPFDRDDHAGIAGGAGAGREFGQSGGAHLLALAIEPQSARDLPARLQRRRPLPDDRSGFRRRRTVLRPRQRGHGDRLRVQRPLHPRDPEPRHRAGIGVSRPQRG